jgi:transposase
MKKGSEVLVGIDTAKANNAVAVAEAGRDGKVQYLGTLDYTPDAVARLVHKLAGRYETLHFCCYKAGPTGYRLYRQIPPHNNAITSVFTLCYILWWVLSVTQ